MYFIECLVCLHVVVLLSCFHMFPCVFHALLIFCIIGQIPIQYVVWTLQNLVDLLGIEDQAVFKVIQSSQAAASVMCKIAALSSLTLQSERVAANARCASRLPNTGLRGISKLQGGKYG